MSSWSAYFEPASGAPAGNVCVSSPAQACDFRGFHTAADVAAAVFPRLASEVAALQRQGIEVVLVGPTPRGPEADPAALYAHEFWLRDPSPPPLALSHYESQAALVLGWLARVSRTTGAPLVDQLGALCPGGRCDVASGGHALYRDGGHLRASTMILPRYAYLDAWLALPAPIRLK